MTIIQNFISGKEIDDKQNLEEALKMSLEFDESEKTIQEKREFLENFSKVFSAPEEIRQKEEIETLSEEEIDGDLDELTTLLYLVKLGYTQKSDLVTDEEKSDFLTEYQEMKNVLEEAKTNGLNAPIPEKMELFEIVLHRMEKLL